MSTSTTQRWVGSTYHIAACAIFDILSFAGPTEGKKMKPWVNRPWERMIKQTITWTSHHHLKELVLYPVTLPSLFILKIIVLMWQPTNISLWCVCKALTAYFIQSDGAKLSSGTLKMRNEADKNCSSWNDHLRVAHKAFKRLWNKARRHRRNKHINSLL